VVRGKPHAGLCYASVFLFPSGSAGRGEGEKYFLSSSVKANHCSIFGDFGKSIEKITEPLDKFYLPR